MEWLGGPGPSRQIELRIIILRNMILRGKSESAGPARRAALAGLGRVVWCGQGPRSLARPSWDDPGDRVAGMAGLAVQARAGLGSGPGCIWNPDHMV